jgi:hypothetical protein
MESVGCPEVAYLHADIFLHLSEALWWVLPKLPLNVV